MLTVPAAVDAYFHSLPVARKPRIVAIHQLIMRLYPTIQTDMKYNMPSYSYADGWVALANQKHYLSFYTCGYQHIKKFKSIYPTIKTGKGCINFKDTDPIDLEALTEVIRHAIEEPHAI